MESYNVTLMYKNIPIVDFSANYSAMNSEFHYNKIYRKDLLPLLVNADNPKSLETCLRDRALPLSREYAKEVCDLLETDYTNKLPFTLVSRGLSLNDAFWLKQDSDPKAEWENINLYDNKFKDALTIISFFGNTTERVAGHLTTPETTTDGMLAKCWRRTEDGIYLYKRGMQGAGNVGREPASEFMASRILEVLNKKFDIPYVPYELTVWEKKLCTRCKLFTDKNTAFIKAGDFGLWKGMSPSEVWQEKEFRKLLDEESNAHLTDMFIFDYVIKNTDRHFGNFGFMYNYETQGLKFAPLFDNGFSLWSGKNDLSENLSREETRFGTFASLNTQAKYSIERRHLNWGKLIADNLDYIVPYSIADKVTDSDCIAKFDRNRVETLRKFLRNTEKSLHELYLARQSDHK